MTAKQPDFSFQTNAVEQVEGALEQHQSVLLQAPTGAGKTRMAMELAKRAGAKGRGPVLFLAESREIIQQTAAAFRAADLLAETLTSTSRTSASRNLLSAPIVIAAQRTAWSRAVRAGHELGEYRTIIIDEAHHIRARTYEELLAKWPDAKRILLTATPVRGDGKGLGNVADAMVQGADYNGNYADLITSGVLVPCPRNRIWTWPKPDMTGVRTQAGDYAMGGKSGAASRMDTPRLIGNIVAHWKELAEGRRTIVYATSVPHAENIAAAFRDINVPAATVHAKTPLDERDQTLARLATGEIRVVTNFGVLTEGFDSPHVACIILARPTKLPGLYIQMVGRGLRTAPDKTDLMVLDHAGLIPKHGQPGTDITWELSKTQNAIRKPQDTITACPECSAALNKDGNCSSCGWQKPRPKIKLNFGPHRPWQSSEFDDDETNLIQLSKERAAEINARFNPPERAEFKRLLERAKKLGRRRGWAAYRYKEIYDAWPDDIWHLPNPAECTQAEFLAAARQYALEKGWKPGWAAFKYKDVYGEWPPR